MTTQITAPNLNRRERYRQRDALTIHAYVLMPNHLHLLLGPVYRVGYLYLQLILPRVVLLGPTQPNGVKLMRQDKGTEGSTNDQQERLS